MKTAFQFVKSMRIYHWVKNIAIFAPTIFSLNLFHINYLRNNLIGFILFSFITGCIYVFNDCLDKKYDQLHPIKRKRPIAANELKVSVAIMIALIILVPICIMIGLFNLEFLKITLIYMFLNVIYSVWFKKIIILDVLIIAVGFALRVKIGGVINRIELSPWIMIITFLGAIFLALIKRRQELVNILNDSDNVNKVETRKTLNKYNVALLDQMISISTTTTLLSYIIYVLHPDIKLKFHTESLYLTVPFVIFGIFRYLYLSYSKGEGENPVKILLSDIPLALNFVIWAAVFIFIVMSHQ